MIYNDPMLRRRKTTPIFVEIIEIRNLDDWHTFVDTSAGLPANTRVELLDDIDCGGEAYDALTFAGDFNGNNYAILNATFNAVDGNCGMFATIGPGQKVCNLVLEDIIIGSGAIYAGILAGRIEGSEDNQALVQNVQVFAGEIESVYGAGGIAGFVSYADVKYCHCENATINSVGVDGGGGGIAGISYGRITDCYSICSPTALLSSGRGGIAGRNLEGGLVYSCWCTYSAAVGTTTDATTDNYMASVKANTSLASLNLDQTYWNGTMGTATDFTDAVIYQF